VVAWLWPEIALLVILFFTSTIIDLSNVSAIPSIPIGIGHLIISDILLFALFGIILLRVLVNSVSYLIHTPLDLPLLAFYGTAILATVIGIINSRSTFNQSLDEIRTVSFFLTFFIVTNLVRKEKQLRRLYDGIILLAIFAAIAMIAQYLLGNGIQILPGRVETLNTAGVSSYGVTRVLPPGQSLVLLGFVCVVVQFLFQRKSSRFVFYLIQVGILGVAVLILALFLLGLLVSLREKVMYVQIIFWAVLLGAFVLTPILIVKGDQAGTFVNGATARLITIINPATLQEPSVVYREIEDQYAYPQIASHPFLGLGLGANYRPWDNRLEGSIYTPDPLTYYIHNGHLWVMLKTGLIGYLCLICFLLLFVIRGLQNWYRLPNPFLKGMVLSFTIMVPGILLACFADPIFQQSYWTPVIGVMLGMGEVALRTINDQSKDSPILEKLN
jgi:hypothetical protein